jgi:hypothetical protein
LAGLLTGFPSAWGQEYPPGAQPPESAVERVDSAAPGGPAPRLELSSHEWDFGFKWFGEPCSTKITITNAGEGPLKILKVNSSCGCTVAKPGKRELLPGESDAMTLSYNTKKKQRIVSQTVTLVTNDPRQPRVAIKVKGEVRQIYEAKPASRITFAGIERDEAATQSIELHNNMEEDVVLELQPIDAEAPFDVELEEIEPGRVYKLSATTKPPLKIGANSANIELETGIEQLPSLTIPVSVYIAPRVAVMPAKLFVSPRVTKPFQRIVRVSYRSDKPVEIKEIKSSHPDLIHGELMPPRKSASRKAVTRVHEIRVTLPAGQDLPEGGGWLEIHTDDPSPEYQKLVVDVELRRVVSRPARSKRAETDRLEPRPAPEPGSPDPPAGGPTSEEEAESEAPD